MATIAQVMTKILKELGVIFDISECTMNIKLRRIGPIPVPV